MLSPDSVSGHVVLMKSTHPLHYNDKILKNEQADDVSGSFGDVLMKAIGKVNNLQVESNDLSQKMISEPESVDVHNVMIALQKAEMALEFTRSVRDEVIKSYRELMNMR